MKGRTKTGGSCRCRLTVTMETAPQLVHAQAAQWQECSALGVAKSGVNNESQRRNGRAIDQAVSRRLPTAAARVRARLKSCGICGGQSVTGTHFLRVLLFPLPILIPPTAPHSSSLSIILDWYNRPNSGLSLTSRQETWKNKAKQSVTSKHLHGLISGTPSSLSSQDSAWSYF
jgi:hypothetical protein